MNDAALDSLSRAYLLQLARESIRAKLAGERPAIRGEKPQNSLLDQPGASFVTLTQYDDLRGCIGSLEAHRILVTDVAQNAVAAATQDPRFPPLRLSELAEVYIAISVLGPLSPIPCASEDDLLRQLEPFRDGLVLQEGYRRGTFLPSVWEQLPDPRQFLRHLKRKAGMPDHHWSREIKIYRYYTDVFADNET